MGNLKHQNMRKIFVVLYILNMREV